MRNRWVFIRGGEKPFRKSVGEGRVKKRFFYFANIFQMAANYNERICLVYFNLLDPVFDEDGKPISNKNAKYKCRCDNVRK